MPQRNTGENFIRLWEWAKSSKKMTEATANQHMRACRLVLESTKQDPSKIDVLELDVEHAVRLFRATNPHLKESTLDTYEHVFRRAVPSYRKYLQDPAAWVPPTKWQRGKKKTPRVHPTSRPKNDSIELKIPLREGKHALLTLPGDLTEADYQLLDKIIPVYLESYAREN